MSNITQITHDNWQVNADEFPYGGNSRSKFQFLLRYATLAPSSHNTQPWLFRIDGDTIELHADLERRLPIADPGNRELVISCGAAFCFLQIAAHFFGIEYDARLIPDKYQPDWLAQLTITDHHEPTEKDKALFAAIPHRRTNRRKFEEREVPDTVIADICEETDRAGASIKVLDSIHDRREIAKLVMESDMVQASDNRFRRELAGWIHANRTRSRDGMPGYAHGIGDIASYFGPFVVRTFDWGKGQAAKDEQLATGSPALAIVSTENDSRTDWLTAGIALGRILLTMTEHGVSASYLNQPVELPTTRFKLQNYLEDYRYPQLLLRMGYGPKVQPTPRRDVQDVIMN